MPDATCVSDLPPASLSNLKFVKSVTMKNNRHEEERIYRRTDHWVLAASRSRHVVLDLCMALGKDKYLSQP